VAPPLTGPARQVVRVELVVLLFVAAVPGIVFGLTGISEPQTVDTDIDTIRLVTSLLASLGPAVLVVFLLWRDGALSLAGFDRPRLWRTVGLGLLAFVCSILAVIAAGIVIAIILGVTGSHAPTVDTADVDVTARFVVIAFAISATAGISEEIVYRGYGITRMEQAGWPRAALWVPLLAWTSQHLYEGWTALLVVGAIGVQMVWIFRWKRSVYPLMIGHLLYDAAIFALSAAR